MSPSFLDTTSKVSEVLSALQAIGEEEENIRQEAAIRPNFYLVHLDKPLP